MYTDILGQSCNYFNQRVRQRVYRRAASFWGMRKTASALSKYLAKVTSEQILSIGSRLIKRVPDPESKVKVQAVTKAMAQLRASGDRDPNILSSRVMDRLIRAVIDPTRDNLDDIYKQGVIKERLLNGLGLENRNPILLQGKGLSNAVANTWLFNSRLVPTDNFVRVGDLPYDLKNIAYRGVTGRSSALLDTEGAIKSLDQNVFVSPNAVAASDYAIPDRLSKSQYPYLFRFNADDLVPTAGRDLNGNIYWTGDGFETKPSIVRKTANQIKSSWGGDYGKSIKEIIDNVKFVSSKDLWVADVPYAGKEVFDGIEFPVFSATSMPFQGLISSLNKVKPAAIYRPTFKKVVTSKSNAPVPSVIKDRPNPHAQFQQMRLKLPFGGNIKTNEDRLKALNKVRRQHGGGELDVLPDGLPNLNETYVPQWNGSKWIDLE
jgi:hypothetical protein